MELLIIIGLVFWAWSAVGDLLRKAPPTEPSQDYANSCEARHAVGRKDFMQWAAANGWEVVDGAWRKVT